MQASKTLGHLARSSVVPNADYVEFEVDRGVEWLSSDQSSRRLAACFVLKELAENAPTLFFAKTGEFLERVWVVLRDQKPIIRLSAARALSGCLRILASRYVVFIYVFIYLFMYVCIYLFIYLFIYVCMYLFIHLFIYVCIYLFIYLFIYSFIYLLIYLFIHPFAPLFWPSKQLTGAP
jgi:hypothetical protein